jgi:hypothetical protein
MGSPPLRLIALLAAGSLAGVAAAPAHADEQGARHAAEAFLQALRMSNSTAACALLTPQALATAGGTAECEKAYGPADESPDYEAYGHLQQALRAAEKSAVKRRGQFVNKRFTVAKLAREMEKIDEELTVKVGQGPGAAAGQLVTTVVLDRRSSARRVVLYAEADDGSIWRLSSVMLGSPDIEEVAQGVPETGPAPREPAFEFTVGSVTFLPDGTALVRASITYRLADESYTYGALMQLAPAGAGYLVADAFYSFVDVTETGG